MRSGWETNANYLCFDAGALGYSGHRHEDKLNVVMWANGRELLFDNGGGPYDSSIWRTWGQSTYSHNTVIVDGLDQEGGDGSVAVTDPDYIAPAPVDIRWESDLSHDFAAGVYNRGYGGSYNNRPATHTRRVLFVKPDIFLIADTLVPTNTASHTYQARWHLRTTNTAFTAATKVVATTDAGLPNLAVIPCLGGTLAVTNVSAQTSASGPGVTNLAEILGWDLPDTTSAVRPAATVTHTLSGTGTQHFLTLFLPLAAGTTNPVLLVSNTGPTSAEIWLDDGRKLRVQADPNPARGLKLTELLSSTATNRYVGAGFQPPVFGGITNRAMNPNTVKSIPFTLVDPDGSATNLLLTASSLTPALVSDTGLALGGSGSNRVLTVTPALNVTGRARILLSATDPDGSTISTDFFLTVNSPPLTNGSIPSTWEEQPLDIDLRSVLGDDLTPPANLVLTTGEAVGGTVALLPDGHTARFTPVTNFSGVASLEILSTDMGLDPRLLLYYHFEEPANLFGGTITDNSDNLRDATLRTNGVGSAALDGEVPAALGTANLGSLRLLESASTNVACLTRLVPTNEFNFSDHDWTFVGWFKRATQTTEDFIFYLGDGDGFGANEELQLHGVANASTLSLRHYIGETNTDVNLWVSGIATGQWHHAAITFARTNASAGILRLYLDGSLAGAGMVSAFNLPQSVPIVFGGHNRATSGQNRWFNGWLDDIAVFNVALTPGEIARLAVRTVGHNAGLTATNLVAVAVRDINDPPTALLGQGVTGLNRSLDLDLRNLSSDIETPAGLLRFVVNPGSNGTVVLLADGHTARFTPAPNFDDGFAGFSFTVTDMGPDGRSVLHYLLRAAGHRGRRRGRRRYRQRSRGLDSDPRRRCIRLCGQRAGSARLV